jgi:hypothetical protein
VFFLVCVLNRFFFTLGWGVVREARGESDVVGVIGVVWRRWMESGCPVYREDLAKEQNATGR